ncbi:putative transposase [Acinetobacter baumannii 1291820]|nr:putative transposase [Acinetobacter baumannii 1291820]EXE06717.1 putative transposase [Acinetobacter baumannii 1277411]
MGSCAAPSAKGDDKFITTDYLQQCPTEYLEYYKKKLLNEGGAIAPYFVKEFTPPVRAVS